MGITKTVWCKVKGKLFPRKITYTVHFNDGLISQLTNIKFEHNIKNSSMYLYNKWTKTDLELFNLERKYAAQNNK